MAETMDSLGEVRIAIFGVGLMGGSLALALQGCCQRLIGVDPDPQTLALARQMNCFDRLVPLEEGLTEEVEVLILAAPIRAILQILGDLPRRFPNPAVVLDLGSTKKHILEAMQRLPERFDPIGGHPMCGKERSSLRHAEAGLYRGATFALVPLTRTTARARRLAEQLVATIGARALWLDAETHDRWAAAVSTLPYLAANVLAGLTPLEAQPLIGPGWHSTTRVASSSRVMCMDILKTNRRNILEGMRRFQQRFAQLERSLAAEDWPGVEALLAQGADQHERLISEKREAAR